MDFETKRKRILADMVEIGREARKQTEYRLSAKHLLGISIFMLFVLAVFIMAQNSDLRDQLRSERMVNQRLAQTVNGFTTLPAAYPGDTDTSLLPPPDATIVPAPDVTVIPGSYTPARNPAPSPNWGSPGESF